MSTNSLPEEGVVQPRRSQPAEALPYRSRFIRRSGKEFSVSSESGNFFSERLTPLLFHPAVREAGPDVREELLAEQLRLYLSFTEELEITLVNPMCALLRSRGFLGWLPPEMKSDAYIVYADEGQHAEWSHALRLQVERAAGVTRAIPRSGAVDKMQALVQSRGTSNEELLHLASVIVSETLITGTLTQLPHDPTVRRSVRRLAEDHAADEGRHHAYFRDIFETIWPRLSTKSQRMIGMLLPKMLLSYLEPDRQALLWMLGGHPEHFSNPEMIVSEVLDHPTVRASVMKAAAPTLRMLARSAVFEDPEIRASFAAAALVPGTDSKRNAA
jgi:hypothetical protein